MTESKLSTTLPLVSVIIPAFNAEQYIHDAINSVLSQSWQHFEIIVVNDGSMDNTLTVLETIKSQTQKLKVISQSNCGSAHARNVGLELACGDYVAFLDADDLWPVYKLELQINFLQKNPNYSVCCGIDAHFDSTTPPSQKMANVINFEEIKLNNEYSGWIFTALFSFTFVHINNLMLESAIAKSCKFDPSLRQGQDTHYWLQIAQKHPVAYIDEILSFYRVHSESISATRFNKVNPRISVIERFLKDYGRCDLEGNCLSSKAECHAFFSAYHNHGNKLLHEGQIKAARYNYFMAIKHNIWNLGTYKNLFKSLLQ